MAQRLCRKAEKRTRLRPRRKHAVLTTSAFPEKTRQLVVRDGVVVINPARTVELVRILREHLIQTHRLRLSADERTSKTSALYEFITSERYHVLVAKQDSVMDEIENLDVKEKKQHDAIWKSRGKLIKDAQKLNSDVSAEIDRIIEDGS